MLSHLDNLLRQVLMDGVTGLQAVPVFPPPPPSLPPVSSEQVGFRPPDDDWINEVKNLQLNALNVCLVDLRENRKLRSNDRERGVLNGVAYEDPAPVRIDCHYLITAWSSTEFLTPQVEPVIDEHQLLYETAAVLFRAPLNPSRVYPSGSAALNAWPARFRDADLPTAVAPVEGFAKLAEFWGTMGSNHRWKPALYLIVTLPIELLRFVSAPIVTTRITEYGQAGQPGSTEEWIQIGGRVLDSRGAQPIPVSGAWVGLETAGGELLQTGETDQQGRFTFGNLRRDTYVLRAKAIGLGELLPTRAIEVPSPTGEYDLRYT
jgi:hypothetical protein